MALTVDNDSRIVSNENNIIIESSNSNSNNLQVSLTDNLKITSRFYQRNLINYLRECLNSLSDRIENNSFFYDSRAEEFQKEIKRLKNKISDREKNGNLLNLNVCLIGNTGSGKSSLINALINHQIMPTDGSGEACTTFLWKIFYNDNNTLDNEFIAEVYVKSFEEYQGEVKRAFELLSEPYNEKQEINSQILSKRNEAEKLLETLFGPKMPNDKNNKEIEFGPKRVTKEMAMTDRLIQEHLKIQIHEIARSNVKDFVKSLKKFLVPKRSDERMSLPTFSGDSYNIPYWPFVKEIHIQGPFEVLKNGVVLVDVPGNGDVNEVRNQIAKNVLDITDHIWIVSDIKRAMSEKNTTNILSESLRDQLKMTGKYLSRTFICTNSDNITLDDSDDSDLDDEFTKEEAKLKKDIKIIENEIIELNDDSNVRKNISVTREKVNKLERESEGKKKRLKEISMILSKQATTRAAKLRNENVKKKILKFESQSQQKNLEFVEYDTSVRDLQVFTVSSIEYMKLKNIMRNDERSLFKSEEDTEIPKLINHLKEISKINILNKIDNIIKHIKALIESMLRYTDDNILLETPEKRKQAKDKFINERVDLIHNYRHIVENIIKEFSNEIDKYIIQRMNVVGKIEAENKCTTIVTNYGNYLHHKIWKATVKRNGYYIDSNGVLHNFNEDLLYPIVKSVTNNWFIVFSEMPKRLVERLETQVDEVIINCFNAINEEILEISPNKKKYIEKFQAEIKENKELNMNTVKEKILSKIKEVQNELQNELQNSMKESMKDAYSNAILESDWQSMKSNLSNYVETNKSKIFEDTINGFKEQILISIDNIQEYIIGTVFITLNENIESDYACFWEISRQSNVISERKNNFITFVDEIVGKLNLIQQNLKEQLSKKEKNSEEVAFIKGKSKRQEVKVENY
ncbi:Dynamin family-domain-containing protein [Rhizophagus diaphanus]|nr:Dynamin family-domain-containing protein [Rhizophagus diaphanus] [Rhizophagus sp. MUCL 43196]